MRRLALSVAVALAPPSSFALCPSDHFEPTLDFGMLHANSGDLRVPQEAEIAFHKGQAGEKEWVEEVLVYIEDGTRDPGFEPSYVVSMLRRESDGKGLLSLHRRRNGLLVTSHVHLEAGEVAEAVREATPILMKTRYADSGCSIHFTDGFIAQMGVAAPTASKSSVGLIGGQVFSPTPTSDAGRAVALGRRLRARALSGDRP